MSLKKVGGFRVNPAFKIYTNKYHRATFYSEHSVKQGLSAVWQEKYSLFSML